MGCCIVGALVISQILLLFRRTRDWLQGRTPGREFEAADWVPHAVAPVPRGRTWRRIVWVVLAIEGGLLAGAVVASLHIGAALHGQRLGQSAQTSGLNLGAWCRPFFPGRQSPGPKS
jgi:hypothetical protein